MVKPNVSKKDKIFYHFDEDNEPMDDERIELLSPLKKDHADLYKIGCMLNNSIRNKDSMPVLIDDSVNDVEYCYLLNEWLNKKQFKYISEGPNCENKTKLWEEKIEELWDPLIKLAYVNFSCERNKIVYNCSISSELKNTLSVCFTLLGIFLITFFFLYKFSPFGHRVDSCLNKKKRIKQNIVPECSCELTEGCYDNGESHSEKGRIRIHYHSA
ncbi:PIR protein [Plasmodium malariae]|uniref:PIR protein n=1 Tax=Plasmodium malariae TaxID=5858 RepID=A0A1D3JMW6_PLAMA|nr:PIR protein [Plasmodium malariae]SBT88039.1 PIR protein [Plasmodium malariae]